MKKNADWEEVVRLAADFQRVQLTTGSQRLSERNCIEIVNRLTDAKLLDIFFTTDGKEYVTPQHLLKEIKDELVVSGGRVNFVELAKSLSIDLSIISKKASDVERADHSVRIINGQLISNNYINTLCGEINEKLASHGQVSIEDLASDYELPGDFLLQIIEKQLGKIVKGIQDKQDRQIFFTQEFVEKNKAIISGALAGITRPILTSTLIQHCNVNERLFLSVVDALIESKTVPGVFMGKQKLTGTYIPFVYTKGQQEWVSNFYKQNGYLELKAMSRLGITEPINFANKLFPNEKLIALQSVLIGPVLMEQVEGALDEAISSGSYVKLTEILPSNFDETDVNMLLDKTLAKKISSTARIFGRTTVVTEYYLKEIVKHFDDGLENAAKRFVSSGDYMSFLIEKVQLKTNDGEKADGKIDKKEERRRKAAEGKTGGGTQGRETKTKSTKKKYLKGKQQDWSDDEEISEKPSKSSQKLDIISRDDILSELKNLEITKDDDEDDGYFGELVEDLANYLHPLLNKSCFDMARAYHESTISSTNQNRKRKINELQEKLNDMLLNVRLFEKGIKHFDSADQPSLVKYLLKSVCTDIVNEVFLFIAQEHTKNYENLMDLTVDQRMKILSEIPTDIKDSLLKFHKSLTGSSIDDFLSSAESALGPNGSDIMVVRHDKKREKPQIINIRQRLMEQLKLTEDPALTLHLSSLILFHSVTQSVLHASGKFVSLILNFLKQNLPADVFDCLKTYHDLVLQFLSDQSDKSSVQSALMEEMEKIKEIALSSKKSGGK